MKLVLSTMVAGGLALAALLLPSESRACGGCFVQQSESTQVTGHRMIFSVSNDKTTLWDQISYAGSPESFVWVLPIHGQVEIALSSDALFNQLEALTQVSLFSPSIQCQPQFCPDENGTITYTATQSGPEPDPVTVIAQATVGPYETVQLASADPLALEAWLDAHGYAVPAEIVPVIDAYVGDGFDFLVMKLVPGKDVSSMRPVRVTSPGAGLSLPLRMVAAGTGATTPLTLWILGEGRYEPANFPWFVIKDDDLVWDWDTQSSNYAELKQQGFAMSQGKGWLVEAAQQVYSGQIDGPLLDLAIYDPNASGYGGDMTPAADECAADLDALYGTLDESSMWLTRLNAELSKEALATDVALGAAMDQSEVSRMHFVTHTKGTEPQCPPPPVCGNDGGGGAGGDGSGASGGNGMASGGCGVSGAEAPFGASLLAGAAAFVAAWRRRRDGRRR